MKLSLIMLVGSVCSATKLNHRTPTLPILAQTTLNEACTSNGGCNWPSEMCATVSMEAVAGDHIFPSRDVCVLKTSCSDEPKKMWTDAGEVKTFTMCMETVLD